MEQSSEQVNNMCSPRELEHKNRRQQACHDVANSELPLGPRTKAFFNVIGEGTMEMVEGAKREFSSRQNNRNTEQNISHNNHNNDHLNETDRNINNDHQENTNYSNEQYYTEKRRNLWNKAADPNLTLAMRTKAGTGAVFAGTMELFEGGKKEFNNRRNNDRNIPKSEVKSEPMETDEDLPNFIPPEVERDNSNSINLDKPPSYATTFPENTKTTIELSKDDVMYDFHDAREREYMRQRQNHLASAKNSNLPFNERFKAGGAALVAATKEMSEGAKREFRETKKNKKIEKE